MIKAVTPSGSRYLYLQDAPGSFHVTMTYGELILYDFFSEIKSEEEFIDNILLMEKSLLSKILPPLDNMSEMSYITDESITQLL